RSTRGSGRGSGVTPAAPASPPLAVHELDRGARDRLVGARVLGVELGRLLVVGADEAAVLQHQARARHAVAEEARVALLVEDRAPDHHVVLARVRALEPVAEEEARGARRLEDVAVLDQQGAAPGDVELLAGAGRAVRHAAGVLEQPLGARLLGLGLEPRAAGAGAGRDRDGPDVAAPDRGRARVALQVVAVGRVEDAAV